MGFLKIGGGGKSLFDIEQFTMSVMGPMSSLMHSFMMTVGMGSSAQVLLGACLINCCTSSSVAGKSSFIGMEGCSQC